MTIYETEIPGVGRKFELELDDGSRAVVVLHHDGRREVFRRPTPEADSEKLFDLTGQQARQLGSVLSGAYFQPVEAGDLAVPLGEAIIEWVEVGPDSPLVGETLAEAEIRARTGASVIAVQRGEDTIPNPGPDAVIEAGDIVVTLGTREEQAAVDDLIEGTLDDDGR